MKQKRAEAIADAVSLASGVPFVPEIKPAWVSWGTDQIRDQTVDSIRNSAPSDSRATYEALDEQTREELTDSTLNLLLRHGYFDDASIDGAADRGVVLTAPPADAIVHSPAGEPLRFDTDSQAYRVWFRSSSVNTIIAESVVGVYADQWGVVP